MKTLIKQAIELLMVLRIKSEKEPVNEKELYDVQMMLYRSLDMIASQSKSLTSDEEMREKYSQLRENIGMFEAIPLFGKWMRSQLLNERESNMTIEQKQRLLQLLANKYSVDELFELTSLLKMDNCKIEIQVKLPSERDVLNGYLNWCKIESIFDSSTLETMASEIDDYLKENT